jgi:hypothetical protein
MTKSVGIFKLLLIANGQCALSSNPYSTKYVYIKSTTVYVTSSELGLSQPLSRQRVCPSPPEPGGGHPSLRVRGWGSPNSDD